jgi:hypothetical protein
MQHQLLQQVLTALNNVRQALNKKYLVALGTQHILCVIEDQTRPSHHIDFCQPLSQNTKN